MKLLKSILSKIEWILAISIVIIPNIIFADAETLSKGDLSFGLYESFEPYNRYWYHFDGATDCGGTPCSRFNLNSYNSTNLPVIEGNTYPIDNNTIVTTSLRVKYGIAKNFTAGLETQFLYATSENGFTLGDSRLNAKWKISSATNFAVSLSSELKIPGIYNDMSVSAPGNKQPDLLFQIHFGGFMAKRKFFYDVSAGYKLRFAYSKPSIVSITPISYNESSTAEYGVAKQIAVSGPSDEASFALTLGAYPIRKLLIYTNLEAVNSTKGASIADYFTSNAALTSVDESNRPLYKVEGDPKYLLTSMEEDHLRLGLGVLWKAFPRATILFNYSYILLGKNTAAFYVIPNTSIPIGTTTLGLEYTFGTKKTKIEQK